MLLIFCHNNLSITILCNPFTNFSSISIINSNRNAVCKNRTIKYPHPDWMVKPYNIDTCSFSYSTFHQSFSKGSIHIIVLLIIISSIILSPLNFMMQCRSQSNFFNSFIPHLNNCVGWLGSATFFFHSDWKLCIYISCPANILCWIWRIKSVT